jgi:uncharacterized protein (DUF1778 family)
MNASSENSRLRRLNIRLSEEEWDKIHHLAAGTTCRSISDYARKVLSRKPVRVFYRNKSFDAFEEQMTRLIPLLENLAAGNDLPAITTTVQEIKTHIEKLSDHATKNNDLPQHHPLPDL